MKHYKTSQHTITDSQTSNRALSRALPELDNGEANEALCALYGVKDRQTLDSIKFLCFSLALGGTCCIVALVVNLIAQ
tara:strand:+ start:777 stop:1010 length:234 start_codon:yes stop_codon:yes gene_type:complete